MRLKLLMVTYSLVLLAIIYMADNREYETIFNHIKVVPYHDKLGHFFLMGLLSFVVNLSFSTARIRVLGVYFLKASLVIALLVTIEELSQLFISSRSFDLGDLFFDYLGIHFFGQLAFHLKNRKAIADESP